MPRCRPFSPTSAFAVALIALGAAPAAADDKVRITVVAILATARDDHVDTKVDCIAREVQKIEPKLTGFRLHQATCRSIPVGGREEFPLIDSEKVTVTAESGITAEGRVGLRVKPSGLGEITYTTACGKCFPIITRYTTKDTRDRLIIAIMVKPCGRK